MKYVALLRGINVGGNKKVPMADLRDMTTGLGFEGAKTLLQSGNLVFDGKDQSTARLEGIFEAATKKTIGVDCSYLIRTADEWASIVAKNPFRQFAESDSARLALTCCREAPDADGLKTLRLEARGDEDFKVVGRELYVWYPDGLGQSRLASALSKNKLGTVCTARNWNTVMKISRACVD
jgi:uncharacterized protein (DUF1697 family)